MENFATNEMHIVGTDVKNCLESLLKIKDCVDIGFAKCKDDIRMLVYIYNSENEEKYTIPFHSGMDGAEICGLVIKDMLNGECEIREPSLEEVYLSGILIETDIEDLDIIDGELVDYKNNISIDLDSLEELHYNRAECNLTLVDKDGYEFFVDLVRQRIIEK